MDVGSYLTAHELRLLVAGVGSGALVGAVARRIRWSPSWLHGYLAPALGLFVAGWWSQPDASVGRVMTAVVVGVLAGRGYDRLSMPTGGRAAVLLVALAGVWLAVPENDPAVVVAGAVVGLGVVGKVDDAGAGYGLSVAVAWTVVLGAGSTPWSFAGGLLGLAPLACVAVVPFRRSPQLPAVRGWLWFLAGSGGVAVLAARWVGVAPAATWLRVGIVCAVAIVVASFTAPSGAPRRRRA
ncbi:MAG: hypothetical protein U5K30_03295 [Acidimicrobiales bacterium]|nr:hypothetical protein [Acidimicrobiales bacterium]